MKKINNIDDILEELTIDKLGHYDNGFYVIDLDDSNEFSKMYTKLDKNAINTENPNIGKNSSNSTVNWTSYFEYSYEDIDYNIFLFGNFDKGTYYIKIGEK